MTRREIDDADLLMSDLDGEALLSYQDGEPLRVGDKDRQRDLHRWELDPVSAEDYVDRSRAVLGESERVRHMGHVDRYGQR